MSQKLSIFAKCAFVIAAIAVLTACCYKVPDNNSAVEVPAWQQLELTNQHGESITFEELQGKPLLAHLVFTRCSMICPLQVSQLAKLQQELNEQYAAESFGLLSISATPDYDTPEKLQEFIARFPVNQSNWNFVTGNPQDIVEVFAGLDAKVSKPSVDGLVNHTSFIYLFDDKGQLVNKIEGVPMNKAAIREGVAELLK